MNRFIPTLFLVVLAVSSIAQTPIDVIESTIKVSGVSEEVFHFGFAEGDQMIFSFEEVNGKELKELEILELPGSSKFMDYKTTKISNKILTIPRTGIYKFRFTNSSLAGRICKLKIQRIPARVESHNFNSAVFWRTVIDTAYTPVQERYLVKSDTSAIEVSDQTARVSSQTAINGSSNKTVVQFELPEGTISWSYYIGVGTPGTKAFQEGREQYLASAAKALVKIPGGAMGALALTGINYFSKAQGEDNVNYSFITDWNSVLLFQASNVFYQYKSGNVITDASKMTSAPANRKIYLGLHNDNLVDPIDVIVKATAIQVKQQWDIRTINKMYLSNRLEAYLKN